jgi:hypothetical protein
MAECSRGSLVARPALGFLDLTMPAPLIDAITEALVWAERFDFETADLFALQNEITTRIAVALNLELIAAEAARPTENPDALDYLLRQSGSRLP